MNFDKLSGLEFVRNILEGHISPGGMVTQVIPIEFIEVDCGYVKFHAKADKRHTNPFAGVHGGFAATVLDSVTACAVQTMLEPGIGLATLDLNIKMLKPIPLGTELVGEGRIIHLSTKIGMSEGTLKDTEGNLYSHGTAVCIINRMSPGSLPFEHPEVKTAR
ncbi:MAG: PaaI family thioesterase [Syntrophorhabdaceae bacterium]